MSEILVFLLPHFCVQAVKAEVLCMMPAHNPIFRFPESSLQFWRSARLRKDTVPPPIESMTKWTWPCHSFLQTCIIVILSISVCSRENQFVFLRLIVSQFFWTFLWCLCMHSTNCMLPIPTVSLELESEYGSLVDWLQTWVLSEPDTFLSKNRFIEETLPWDTSYSVKPKKGSSGTL